MGVKFQPEVMTGKVMHARLFPKENKFCYGIYYLSLPLSQRRSAPVAYNRAGMMSFHDKDHGPCNGNDLESWAREILNRYNIEKADGQIVLVCMPRILGYVFNPVSFWFCHDKSENLRAVICEVRNTFGENHNYLCAHKDHAPITHNDILKGDKIFHVSPFIDRAGNYTFRFDLRSGKFGAWIDYFDENGKKQLLTSLIGARAPMTKHTLKKAFWTHPLVTIKAVALIHWQAIKLMSKGIKYISKPTQKKEKLSTTQNLKKM